MFSGNQGGMNGGSMNASGFGGFGGGNDFANGLTQFFGGLFGNSGEPYKKAGNELEDYLRRATSGQNPFLNMGKDAIPRYQEWLNGMKDPSGFINNLMGNYSESPWAKYQQQQALRASGNQGSASGLGGSTPMAQFNQQNARDISSQDMNQWLQNVLGVNTQYGEGQHNMINGGQHAADMLSNLYGRFGEDIAGARYNQAAGRNKDRNDLWGGWFNTGKGAAELFGGM
jgi:hypothetical protein